MAKRNRKARRASGKPEASTALTMYRPKTNFQGPKQAPPVMRAPRFRGSQRRALSSVPPAVSAFVDPWSPDADGVRYSDDFLGLSGTFTSNYEAQLATTPATGTYTDLNLVARTPVPGTCLFLVTPDPSNVVVVGINGSATSPNFFWPNGIVFTNAAHSLNAFGPGTGINAVGDNVVSNIVALRELYASCRLVAGGLKITSTSNFSTVSGTIHVAPIFINYSREVTNLTNANFGGANPITSEQQNGWQTALPNDFNSLINLPGYQEYPMSALESDELLALFKRYGPEAKSFKPTATAWGIDDNSLGTLASRYGDADMPDGTGHYALCVFVTGLQTSTGAAAAASTPFAQLEVRLHYEAQPNPSAAIYNLFATGGGLITPAPPYQPVLDAATDNVCAAIPAVRCVDDAGVEEEAFVKDIVTFWKQACSVASGVTAAVSTASTLFSMLSI